MTNPFDADNLFRRSIFSSILGLGRKTKSTEKVGSVKNGASCTAANVYGTNSIIFNKPANICPRKYRTKQEIYDEIVCECAELEKNKATTKPKAVEYRSVACSTDEPMDTTTSPSSPENPLTEQRNATETLENLVRLVVTAVKDSGILKQHDGKISPEDILKRKRMQNNEAAARYRRRQREIKEEAEVELAMLTFKNDELRQKIKRMQIEINQLKGQVLKRQIDRTE